MLAELLNGIVELGRESGGLKIVPEPNSHRYYLHDVSAGTHELAETPPTARAHRASDFETIVALARKNKDGAVVWYSRGGIVLLVDDETRRDRVTLSFELSPQIAALQLLEKQQRAMTQSDLRNLLRRVFKNCLSQSGNIIELISNLKFTVATDGRSEVSQGKSSIGKALEAQLTGQSVIPEYITLSVPVFVAAYIVPQSVQCVLDLEPTNQTFQLIPVAGELEKAITAAERAVGESLISELDREVPVYFGTP
mgnify:CR=1 FL=1